MRSRPARSWWIATAVKPAAVGEREDRLPWVSPISSTRTPCGASQAGASRTMCSIASSPEGAGVERADGLPPRDLGGQHVGRGDVRRVRHDQVESAPQLRRAARRTSAPPRAAPLPPLARLRRGSHAPRRARRRTLSVAQRSARPSGSSYASESAIAPEPVPRSAITRVRRSANISRAEAQRALDDLLGLGTRDEHPRVDPQVELTERPRSEHVLQRLALGAASDHRFEVRHRHLRRHAVELTSRRLLGDPLRLSPRRAAAAVAATIRSSQDG